MFCVKPLILSDSGDTVEALGRRLRSDSGQIEDVMRALRSMKGFEACLQSLSRMTGQVEDIGRTYQRMGESLHVISGDYRMAERRAEDGMSGIGGITRRTTETIQVGTLKKPEEGSKLRGVLDDISSSMI